MDKAYYLEYFHLERDHWWFRARSNMLQIMITSLQLRQPVSILNVGAATGASSDMLGKFGSVVSLEYDKDCCAFVKDKLGIDFINASITELPFSDEAFDVVCAFDVIEHVADDVMAVKELMRVCKREGYILTTVPAYRFLWSHHDVVNQHMRRYTKKEFKKLFMQSTTTTYSGY
ncbi:MAG: class I SAM-dependent methyltransferase, partial [Bacteroidota bacterium]